MYCASLKLHFISSFYWVLFISMGPWSQNAMPKNVTPPEDVERIQERKRERQRDRKKERARERRDRRWSIVFLLNTFSGLSGIPFNGDTWCIMTNEVCHSITVTGYVNCPNLQHGYPQSRCLSILDSADMVPWIPMQGISSDDARIIPRMGLSLRIRRQPWWDRPKPCAPYISWSTCREPTASRRESEKEGGEKGREDCTHRPGKPLVAVLVSFHKGCWRKVVTCIILLCSWQILCTKLLY